MTAEREISQEAREKLREAAATIRDHVENKKPTQCNPTFMDADDQWWQIREWPEMGLTRHSTGPRGKKSKVKPATSWTHRLLPDAYPTLQELLAAMDAAALAERAP